MAETHLYRKEFPNRHEAEIAAEGFDLYGGNIDKPGPTKVAVAEEDGQFFVYVELTGDIDAEEVLVATGYERVR